MQKRLEIKVTGRVQGVMFRDFTCRKGRKLGFVGTVQNKNDGSVEIFAEGDVEKISAFMDYLHKGSIFSRVDNVEMKETEPSGEFKNFRILYN